MASSLSAPGDRVRSLWGRLSGLPGGRTLFSFLFGKMAPYTGRLGARVETLEPGFCRVTLRDRRAVRNHLNSIHAMALANLAEAASGLAVVAALPPGVRASPGSDQLSEEGARPAGGRVPRGRRERDGGARTAGRSHDLGRCGGRRRAGDGDMAPPATLVTQPASGGALPASVGARHVAPLQTPLTLQSPLTRQLGIQIPLICGAMYPCSNPELVAAVSAAGGIGVVQPLSMIYVYGHDFRDGLKLIRRLTDKPIGMNVLIERSSKLYLERMSRWVDIALDEGVRFFVTSLGNPRWVVERVAPLGGIVYHDVTERKWAEKGLAGGVHGLIAVNDRAGGHAGGLSAAALLDQLRDLNVPVVCAGGVGDAADFVAALKLGYAGVQMGTRFIATTECGAHDDYKQAIVSASEQDVVLTERVTGVPLAVINTPYVQRIGTRAGPIARWMLRGRKTKHLMRTVYALRSLWQLKRASLAGGAREASSKDYWQAGKSVAGIEKIESAGDIVRRFAAAASSA
jgi:nitronate monooxygenase